VPFLLATLLAVVRPDPTPAPNPLEAGERLLGRKQYAAAETELRRAVEADPNSARAHGNLALALLNQRKTREAVDEGRLAAAFGPDLPEARYIYGLALSAAGKPVDAAREYEKALALKPAAPGPLSSLAAAYAASEDERTAATYEKLIALRPADAKPRQDLAEYLWAVGKIGEGNGAMEAAASAFPSDAGIRLRYGRALIQQERFVDAAVTLEEARRLGATQTETFALLARVYEESGRADEARATLTAGLVMHPEAAVFEHDLGRLELSDGRAEQALGHLEAAARSAPSDARYQLDYGRALEAVGRPRDAEAAYRLAVRLAPNLPGAHFALGRLLQRQGQKEEAEKELAQHHALYERGRQAVAAADSRDASASLAWSELKAGKNAEALDRFRSLPESPDTLKGQAEALDRLGRPAEAVRALERAQELAPDDARIQLLLATARSKAAEPR
jgi:Flp pilus assembly protein TadD